MTSAPKLSDAVLCGDDAAVMRCLSASQLEHDKNSAAIRARVGNPPPTRECRIHPDQLEQFSNRDSAACRRPCYSPCPECRREVEILAPKLKFWREHGLPALYFGRTLDDLEFSDPERDALEGFQREAIGILALLGRSGTGKTSAACAILQAQRSGRYATRADVLSGLRATYTSKRGELSGDTLKRGLIETRMLVLDEFEKTDSGGDGQRLLFEVLDGRYREGRPTIICGNCTLADFKTIVGTAGFSRMTESGGRILEFSGRDRRPDGRDRHREQVTLVRRLENITEGWAA